MLRRSIDLITKFFTWTKRNRRVSLGDDIVMVNLGCGLSVASGWVNIDGSLNSLIAKWPEGICRIFYKLSGSHNYYSFEQYHKILKSGRFIHHNLEYGIPLDDESVDFLYSSHFLEHLTKNNAKKLLRESYRVLKKGGILRVCVPDLEYAINLYAQEKKQEMLDKYFFVEEGLGYYARHKYMYDFELMKRFLVESGFSDVQRVAHKQGKTPDIENLDIYPEVTLYIEAVKNDTCN